MKSYNSLPNSRGQAEALLQRQAKGDKVISQFKTSNSQYVRWSEKYHSSSAPQNSNTQKHWNLKNCIKNSKFKINKITTQSKANEIEYLLDAELNKFMNKIKYSFCYFPSCLS